MSAFRIAAVMACLCLVPLGAARAANITGEDWGTLQSGEKVSLFTLKGAHGLEARITNYGGRIVSLYVPNAQGTRTDVQLGFDDLASYEKDGFYGALVGRYVGRISHGGSFMLDGKTYQLEKTDPAAPFVIHGGTAGFQRKLWKARMHDGPEPSLTLTLVSPDGDGGFPGQLTTTVTYTVTKDNALKLDYRATSDRPTVASLTNHAYFALQGEGNGDISDEMMQVFADRFTPADEGNLVTGKILPVEGTPADFRQPVRVGDRRTSDWPQIAMRKGIELEFVINGKPGALRPAARMTDPHTGIVMDVSTTQPCMVVYGDSIGANTVTGKGGKTYRNFYAMSFETEGYLDAVHHPNFASTVVTPDKPMHEVTVFKFSTR
ncbi:MAG TPA: aldose epimerase family protein [Rhizomicrobium sp.]|jgi:aldose 1-epimerase